MEPAHRHVLGRPGPDPGERAEPLDDLFQASSGREEIGLAGDAGSHRREVPRPGPGEAGDRQIGIGERFGGRERTRKSRDALERLAESLDQPCAEGGRGRDADLLAHDGADHRLEGIPGARNAQPGPLADGIGERLAPR